MDGDGTKDADEAPAALWFDLETGTGVFAESKRTDPDTGLATLGPVAPGSYKVTLNLIDGLDPEGLAIVTGDLDPDTLTSEAFTLAADDTKSLTVGVVDDAHPATNGPGGQNPDVVKVAAGGHVTVTGQGFDAAEPVEVWVHSDPVKLADIVAAADGTAGTTITIPANLPAGAHRIELRGLTSGVSTWTDIEVTAAPADGAGAGTAVGTGTLASTGAGQLGTLLIAVGLMVGLGGLLLVRKPGLENAAV